MILFPPAQNGSDNLLMSSIQFDNFNVSWAGPRPRTEGFCFGSEDGGLLFTDSAGVPLHREPDKVALSGEAINGVAFIRNWMAISTRKEINLFKGRRQEGQETLVTQIPFGAHGVIASASGFFLASLGRAGLMFVQPADGPEQSVKISTPAEALYVYRLIALRASNGQHIVACAARTGGVAAMKFEAEDQKQTLSLLTFDGLDVVDLCPLNAGENGTAAAAVARDGTLILFRDVLHDRQPATLRYPGAIKGTSYRLLSCRGHLFLLTSKAMYVITGLIDRFLDGTANNQLTPILEVPLEAVDANLSRRALATDRHA